MREINVSTNEAGQRLDKLLRKYLKNAGTSFIYKMLRKKNIVLNERKAEGREILQPGDSVKMYFSEDTFRVMTGEMPAPLGPGNRSDSRTETDNAKEPTAKNTHDLTKPENEGTAVHIKDSAGWHAMSAAELAHFRTLIVYEDAQLLVLNKPAGWLSQSDGSGDASVNECCLSYLRTIGELSDAQLRTFKPGIANRLDRNTSGLILFGKTLPALQSLAVLLRERSLEKYYLTVVAGCLSAPQRIDGYLLKDERRNRVEIRKTAFPDAAEIHTAYVPLKTTKDYTVLKVHLITGKTHQIRAHLRSIGHPILGDPKYGDPKQNAAFRLQGRNRAQLLHAWELHFPPALSGVLHPLAGRTLQAAPPKEFARFVMV